MNSQLVHIAIIHFAGKDTCNELDCSWNFILPKCYCCDNNVDYTMYTQISLKVPKHYVSTSHAIPPLNYPFRQTRNLALCGGSMKFNIEVLVPGFFVTS